MKLVVSTTSVLPSQRPRASPMYCRIAGREVRPAVERNHARVVHHLVGDGHDARALVNLVRVAVDGRHHRAGHAARDAAIVEAAVLPRVGRPAALRAACCARAARCCASAVCGGTLPSGGSTTSQARLFAAL